jgi:integral membrane protein
VAERTRLLSEYGVYSSIEGSNPSLSVFRLMTLRNFRYLAAAEATSYLLLFAGIALKAADVTEWGVHIMGSKHGLLFIAYLAFAISLCKPAGWTLVQTFLILAGSVIPLGGYVVDWWLAQGGFS